jgi:GTP pyrophosphokinase
MVSPPPAPSPPISGLTQAVERESQEFFSLIDTYLNSADRQRVREAHDLARREHGDQRRHSGDLFFIHPLTVALYLAEYRLDAAALAAALLHDVAEDTRVSIDEIRAHFGQDVSRLVDGVTKLKEVTAGVARDSHSLSPAEIRDATLRKLFEAMIADVRVVIVKLFDRLHNMRTIKALVVAKQRQKAEETLAIYAPLANRLGIWRLKNELEALSLEVLHGRPYQVIKQELERLFHEQQAAYAQVTQEIIEALVQANIKVVNVLPCPENIYTAYLHATHSSIPYEAVDRTLRVVVLLEEKFTCYQALGHIHDLWRPVPATFDDYIAVPRDNLYRALHTTVIHSSGQPLKVRFRTVSMNEVSEIGVLARWVYAGTPLWTRGIADRVEALFANINESIRLEPQDASAGVRGVVEDVFGKQIMVYTPRGDIVELPLGATPIDFAFAIHTAIGNQCHAAFINEQRQPLNRPLSDGDRVRIVKMPSTRPHRTWLDEDLGYIFTNRARSMVRRWFRRLPERQAIAEGKKLLEDEMHMLGLDSYSTREIAAHFGYPNEMELYHALGRADLLPTLVATDVLNARWHEEPLRNVGNIVCGAGGEEYVINYAGGRSVRLCQTCNPRPGETIVGFIRLDGGVTVHKEGCRTLRQDPLAERTLKLAWGKAGAQEAVRPVSIRVEVHDRKGLLFEIARLMQDEDVNISAVSTGRNGVAGDVYLTLDLEVASPRQLVRILHRVHALVNVFSVRLLARNGHTPPSPALDPASRPAYRPE